MKKAIRALVVLSLVWAVAAAVAWALGQGGAEYQGVPVVALCIFAAFAIQWLMFIPAFAFQTEKYFDLTGSATYLSVVALALLLSGPVDLRSGLIAAFVILWALRLGSFLFIRIRQDGEDVRFREIKPNFWRFFVVWNVQGLWVSLTLAAAFVALTTATSKPVDAYLVLGALLWLAGFAIEASADAQKRRFRADAANRGQFIQSGLWAWSRHPNYFGEITLWLGIAIMAAPLMAASTWQLVGWVSPLFVYLLLTRVSGITKLEAIAEERWGDEPAYQHYRDNTPALILRPPRG